MIDAIVGAVERLGLTPLHLVGAGIGLLVSWGVTQAIKKLAGLHGRQAIVLAGLVAFLATYTIIPDNGWLSFWLAAVVALLSPTVYRILVAVGRARGWAWTAALSGDPEK